MATQVYVRTHSLLLGSGDVDLVWCASSDDGATHFRVVRVERIGTAGNLQTVGPTLAAGTVPVGVQSPPWSGEETGYGWTEITTTLPDLVGGNETSSGLYALELGTQPGGTFSPLKNAYFVLRRRTSATKMVVCYPFATLVAYAGAG